MISARRSAMTLMELLVVITVIAILVSLLLPAVTTVMASARTVACMSTMRQLGMGHQAYADDNAGRGITYWDSRLAPYPMWTQRLCLYLDPAVDGFWCPANRQAVKRIPDGNRAWPGRGVVKVRSSYGLVTSGHWNGPSDDESMIVNGVYQSCWNSSDLPWTTWNTSKNLTACADSSGTALLGERPDGVLPWANDWGHPWGSYIDTDWFVVPLHRKRSNWLFADLHVAGLTLAQAVGTGTIGGRVRGVWTRQMGD